MTLKEDLKKFEAKLDARLDASAIYRTHASTALAGLVNLSDMLAHQNPMANFPDAGINILAPYLVSGATGGTSLDSDSLVRDIEFCAHYYMLKSPAFSVALPARNIPTETSGIVTLDRNYTL